MSEETLSTNRNEQSMSDRVREALIGLEYNISTIRTPDDVEMHAYHIMDKMPETQQTAIEISHIRQRGGDDTEAVSRQAGYFKNIKEEIALIAGVELEETRAVRENEEYRQKARKIFEGINLADDREVLVKTEFLKPTETGEVSFQFPDTLFPPHIVDKWSHYIDLVKRHTTVIAKRELGLDNDVETIAQLDSVRKRAHNNLSLSMQEFLGNDDWDLEQCRRLVIKMRDAAIPNIETAEENVTASAVRQMLLELEDLRAKPEHKV